MERLRLMLIFLESVVCFAGADVPVSAAEGQDCVLPCTGLSGLRVSDLEWAHSDKVLLVFRGGNVLNRYEHSDYTNRVQLLDPQLLRGNLSVVLKEVRFNDSGTYKCLCFYEDKQKISQFIHLTVTQRDTTNIRTNTGLSQIQIIGAVSGAVVFVLFILVVTVLVRRRMILKQSRDSQFKSKEPYFKHEGVQSSFLMSHDPNSHSTVSSKLSDVPTPALLMNKSSPSSQKTYHYETKLYPSLHELPVDGFRGSRPGT